MHLVLNITVDFRLAVTLSSELNTDLIVNHVEIEVQVDLLPFFFGLFVSALEDLNIFCVKRMDFLLDVIHFVTLRGGVPARVRGLAAV